jgi:hypothetical protein
MMEAEFYMYCLGPITVSAQVWGLQLDVPTVFPLCLN